MSAIKKLEKQLHKIKQSKAEMELGMKLNVAEFIEQHSILCKMLVETSKELENAKNSEILNNKK